jgi:hypothetical protein
MGGTGRIAGCALVLGSIFAMDHAAAIWTFAALGLVTLSGVWLALRCPHSGPLGLLPPVMNERRERVPARWYCDACGRTWPAGIEHGKPPIQKFSG